MKKRLDIVLVERGLAASRTQAQALIMAGQVSAEGRRLEKAGLLVDDAIVVHVRHQPRYASRAGEKLASVAGEIGMDVRGKVVLDVGSSTGGFTDFVLQQGACEVYCVDVGTGQLAYKLRQDPRVVVMEQTDIREVTVGEGAKMIRKYADMAVIDVSFISLTKILEVVAGLVKPGGVIVAMAKPQFEAGKAVADRYHGVIPVGPVRDEILGELRSWMQELFDIVAEADSAVAGMEGNVEHFFVLKSKIANVE